MKGAHYIAASTASGVALMSLLGLAPSDIAWSALLCGSIVPDLDRDSSDTTKLGSALGSFLPGSWVKAIDFFFDAIRKVVSGVFRGLPILHSPLIPLAMMFLGGESGTPWVIWFSLAYLTHLVVDFFTSDGIALFGPLLPISLKWSPIKNSEAYSRVVFICAMSFLVYAAWERCSPNTRDFFSTRAEKLVQHSVPRRVSLPNASLSPTFTEEFDR